MELEGSKSMALQSSEAPPGEGWVTVGEVECRFLARSPEDEANFAAVGVTISTFKYLGGL